MEQLEYRLGDVGYRILLSASDIDMGAVKWSGIRVRNTVSKLIDCSKEHFAKYARKSTYLHLSMAGLNSSSNKNRLADCLH